MSGYPTEGAVDIPTRRDDGQPNFVFVRNIWHIPESMAIKTFFLTLPHALKLSFMAVCILVACDSMSLNWLHNLSNMGS